MRRAALAGVGLAVLLAGCGGTRDDSTEPGAASTGTPAPSAAPSTAAPTAAPTAPPTAAPTAAPTAPAAQECPLKARPVPAPAGATTDLKTKPVVPGNPAPPPADVTVADIVAGTGPEATTLSQVSVKYVGVLYGPGTEFDSSWKDGPDKTIDFAVCSQGTVPGFSIAPTGMKVGGRRQVTIPALYGYGNQANGPIPAGSTLVFVIDLVKVTPPAG